MFLQRLENVVVVLVDFHILVEVEATTRAMIGGVGNSALSG